MQSPKNYDVLDTNGNGNCAFHAFFDALMHEVKKIHRKQEDDRKTVELSFYQDLLSKNEFISIAAKILNKPNNTHQDKEKIINALCCEHDKDRVGLQVKFGDALRAFSIELLRGDKEAQERSCIMMINAFHNANEDVFRRHRFVRGIFTTALYKENPTEYLKNWWNTRGYKKFLDVMADPSKKEYAGDFELVTLARYFNLNLDIQFRNAERFTTLYSHRGNFSLKGFSFEQSKALIRYGVIEGVITEGDYTPDNTLILPCQRMTEDELRIRLEDCYFNEFDKVAVIDRWKISYQEGITLSLTNPHAVHWSSMRLKSAAEPADDYSLDDNDFVENPVSFTILNSFMVVLGIAAVALAFTVLNASSLGLVLVGVGLGLFIAGAYRFFNEDGSQIDDQDFYATESCASFPKE